MFTYLSHLFKISFVCNFTLITSVPLFLFTRSKFVVSNLSSFVRFDVSL